MLADELGITKQSLGNKLSKRSPFTVDEILKISALSGKTMEYLLETQVTAERCCSRG
jgi:plasmid maintenance system antidote protein VapI